TQPGTHPSHPARLQPLLPSQGPTPLSQPTVLYPWRRKSSGGLSRVKRDWIIPPIRVSENSKQVPENLVQIKSDKVFTGEVIYKLEGPGVDQDPKNLFEIDDKTGWIRSMMPLDREKYRSFTLKAFALSPSGERLENPSTIEILVLDQNDNRPKFSQKEFAGAVAEFSVPGTSVMSVTATDADDPTTDNAMLSYSIIGQESIPPLRINKTILKVLVADMSGMGLTSEAHAIINVNDINNNRPRFSPDQYIMSAVENKVGFVIGWVNATDKDEPGTGNWQAKYTITKGDSSGNFDIHTDPGTNQGILSVIKALDFESQTEHTLTLTVENVNPLSIKAPNDPMSIATVVVNVANENEAPRFNKDPIEIVVPESVAPGTLLASNIAYDPDNAKLRYDIPRDPEGWLIIDAETGEIKARRSFSVRSPHVKNNIYTAVIRVTDTDSGGISTTASLVISLRETNDFPPQLFPLMGTVCSEAGRGTPGLVLTAVDEDLAPHAEPFTFDLPIEVSANWTIMQVNETHAMLHPLVELETGEYVVTVLVTDSGSPSLTASAQVNVSVCSCGKDSDCKSESAAVTSNQVGVSFIALLVVMASIALLLSELYLENTSPEPCLCGRAHARAHTHTHTHTHTDTHSLSLMCVCSEIGLLVFAVLLLLAVAVGNCRRHHMKKGQGLLVGESDDDIRDNVLNYDEQGGGEEDEVSKHHIVLQSGIKKSML
uniref:Cadherin domain-containing protein n=1 Tax=Esox lucius TaxID=8010 RepID=A0AAY5KGM5_ESOLU